MKLFLTKLRISSALDSGKPLPESLRRKIAADPELERFVRQSQILERNAPEPPPSDPALHDSIMLAVRATARRWQRKHAPALSWLAPAATLAALALAGAWVLQSRNALRAKVPMDGPIALLEMGKGMSATVPSMVMAPLTNEWARVSHDVEDTKQIVLGSFPF